MRASRPVFLGLLALQLAFGRPDTVYRGTAVKCIEGRSERASMRSTSRLPEASGGARVERRGGMTEIDVELDSMKPASLFGGDYNTYVLWVVPPGGPAENLGEVPIEDDQGRLRASTRTCSFVVLVSAEPHYLVEAPSAFIVLETHGDDGNAVVEQLLVSGIYNYARSTLADVKEAKGKVHSDVRQAFTAVRLAGRAGAGSLAADEMAQAQRALDATLALWHERKDRSIIAAQARETIRLAVAARRLAAERALQGTRGAEGSGGGNSGTDGRDPRGR